MATIIINNYIQGAVLYGVELVSGEIYTQSATPAFLALLTTGTDRNNVYQGSILADTSAISAPANTSTASIVFEPLLAQSYTAYLNVNVVGVGTPFATSLSGAGTNPWSISKDDCSKIAENITHQFRAGG